jgi:hypothetical protein
MRQCTKAHAIIFSYFQHFSFFIAIDFFSPMPKFLVNGIADPTNTIVDVPKLQAGY